MQQLSFVKLVEFVEFERKKPSKNRKRDLFRHGLRYLLPISIQGMNICQDSCRSCRKIAYKSRKWIE